MVTTEPGNSDQEKISKYKVSRDELYSKMTPEQRMEFASHHKDPLNSSFQNTHSYNDLAIYIQQLAQYLVSKSNRRLSIFSNTGFAPWDWFIKTGGHIFSGSGNPNNQQDPLHGASNSNSNSHSSLEMSLTLCKLAKNFVELYPKTSMSRFITTPFTKADDRFRRYHRTANRFSLRYYPHHKQAEKANQDLIQMMTYYQTEMSKNSFNPKQISLDRLPALRETDTLIAYKKIFESLLYGTKQTRWTTDIDILTPPEKHLPNLLSNILQETKKEKYGARYKSFFTAKMNKTLEEVIANMHTASMRDIYAQYFHAMDVHNKFLKLPKDSPHLHTKIRTTTREQRMKKKWHNDKEYYTAPDNQKNVVKENKYYNIEVMISSQAYLPPSKRKKFLFGLKKIYSDVDTVIYRKASMMFFGYKGTSVNMSWRSFKEIFGDDVSILLTQLEKTSVHKNDKILFEKMYKLYKPKVVRFTGHSRGGSRAALMSKTYSFPGSGFASGYTPLPIPAVASVFNGNTLPYQVPAKHDFHYYVSADSDILSDAAKSHEQGVNKVTAIERTSNAIFPHYLVNFVPRRLWHPTDIKEYDESIQKDYVGEPVHPRDEGF